MTRTGPSQQVTRHLESVCWLGIDGLQSGRGGEVTWLGTQGPLKGTKEGSAARRKWDPRGCWWSLHQRHREPQDNRITWRLDWWKKVPQIRCSQKEVQHPEGRARARLSLAWGICGYLLAWRTELNARFPSCWIQPVLQMDWGNRNPGAFHKGAW